MGTRGLLRHRFPLHSGGERGAATTHELRILDLSDGERGADVDRATQRGVATLGAVLVEGARLHDPDAREETTTGRGSHRGRHRSRVGGDTVEARGERARGDRRNRFGRPPLPRSLHEDRGRALTQAEARALDPHPTVRFVVLAADLVAAGLLDRSRAVRAAHDIVADMDDRRLGRGLTEYIA